MLLSIFVQIAIVAASVIPSSPSERLTTRKATVTLPQPGPVTLPQPGPVTLPKPGPVTLSKPGPCYTHLQFKQVCLPSEPQPYINISKFYNGDKKINDVGWHNFIGHNGMNGMVIKNIGLPANSSFMVGEYDVLFDEPLKLAMQYQNCNWDTLYADEPCGKCNVGAWTEDWNNETCKDKEMAGKFRTSDMDCFFDCTDPAPSPCLFCDK